MSDVGALINALSGGANCPPEQSPLGWLRALIEDARQRGPSPDSKDPDAHWQMVREVEQLYTRVRAALGSPWTLSIEAMAGMAMPDDFLAWYPRLKPKRGARLPAGQAYENYVKFAHRRKATPLPPEKWGRLMTAIVNTSGGSVLSKKVGGGRVYFGWELDDGAAETHGNPE